MQQSQPLVFQDVTFAVIDRAGEPWLRVSQIATAFGYRQSSRLQDVYKRHEAEFTSTMTALIEVKTKGGPQQIRIFSLRGAHLLGMFARTPRAVEFRRWVLNVLESWRDQVRVALPTVETEINKDTELAIKQRAKVLADSFYPLYCLQMRNLVKTGQLAGAHVASWLPGAVAGFGLSGEKNSRWTVCYDGNGLPTVQRLKVGQILVDWADYSKLQDALTAFRQRYEKPMGLPAH